MMSCLDKWLSSDDVVFNRTLTTSPGAIRSVIDELLDQDTELLPAVFLELEVEGSGHEGKHGQQRSGADRGDYVGFTVGLKHR